MRYIKIESTEKDDFCLRLELCGEGKFFCIPYRYHGGLKNAWIIKEASEYCDFCDVFNIHAAQRLDLVANYDITKSLKPARLISNNTAQNILVQRQIDMTTAFHDKISKYY